MEQLAPAEMEKVPTFGLLPEPKTTSGAFLGSAAVNVALLGLFLVLSVYMWRQRILVHNNVQLTMVPIKQEDKPKPKPKPVEHVVPPTPELIKELAPKIVYHAEVQENAPHMVQIKVANAPVLPPYRPVDVALPPQPKVGMFQSNTATQVANNQGRPSPKTGGFGDPTGARVNPNSSASQLAAYGSFQNAPGEGSGSGMARKGSVHGVSFGSGYANGQPGGGGHGKVSSAGFATAMVGAAHGPQGTVQNTAFTTTVARPTGPTVAQVQQDFQQVKILYHPRPEYTPEAKQLHIQGEVVLEVRFSANGDVQVLRVVHGLGHGLDEQAIRAAEQTRFKPAMKDGRPIDMTTYYRIDFQLA